MNNEPCTNSKRRVNVWYGLILIVMAVFVVRLFYLQIIQYNYYKNVALLGQLKEYEVEADRGVIVAHDGANLLPIVLNETRYTLFADPKFVKEPETTAQKIQAIIGGDIADYTKKIKSDTRYAVLAKKLDKDKKEAIDKLGLKGIGTRAAAYRSYPQGDLAAQVLGFVNDDGEGKYGLEQAMGIELKGKPGQIKAITDAQGVPLVANKDNIVRQPEAGDRLVTTLNIPMQKQLEDILKRGLDAAKSPSGSALIMDPNTGAIKAIANYPSFNPSEFYKVDDASLFGNPAVSAPLEVGSVMKVLTTATALDLGVINKNTSYDDPGRFVVDGFTVKNVEEDGGPGRHNLGDILQLSLNTGATWLLMQMGGGQINQKARTSWHDYMTDHYEFGKTTGIEQGYESAGTIPSPSEGFGLNLQYANTAFGQGMSATPLQLAGALSSVINGGTYYRPRLVDQLEHFDGTVTKKMPEVVRTGVVKPEVSGEIRDLMQYVVDKNHVLYGLPNLRAGYTIGGKTGTAQIAKPGGGYYDDKFNGLFTGFVGGDKPEYVIVVRVNEPKVFGYAGAKAAAPIFSNVANMLIDNFGVTPKGN